MSLFCLQIFKAPLLHVLGAPVNYHNGLLPKYGGLSGTAWSMYCGETDTGFTFHRMNEKIDGGPILLTGTIPIEPHSTPRELEWEKTLQASRHIPRVLDLMWEKTPGTEQKGVASYFDQKAGQAIVNIDHSIPLFRRRTLEEDPLFPDPEYQNRIEVLPGHPPGKG